MAVTENKNLEKWVGLSNSRFWEQSGLFEV